MRGPGTRAGGGVRRVHRTPSPHASQFTAPRRRTRPGSSHSRLAQRRVVSLNAPPSNVADCDGAGRDWPRVGHELQEHAFDTRRRQAHAPELVNRCVYGRSQYGSALGRIQRDDFGRYVSECGEERPGGWKCRRWHATGFGSENRKRKTAANVRPAGDTRDRKFEGRSSSVAGRRRSVAPAVRVIPLDAPGYDAATEMIPRGQRGLRALRVRGWFEPRVE